MIKPRFRKWAGISALIINTIALFISLATKQTDIAKLCIYINSTAIILWFTSEGFVEYLLAIYIKKE